MPTIFRTFLQKPTLSKRSVRKLNALCNLSVRINATNPSSAYKNASNLWIFSPYSSSPSYVGTTTITHFRILAPSTTLKTVGENR